MAHSTLTPIKWKISEFRLEDELSGRSSETEPFQRSKESQGQTHNIRKLRLTPMRKGARARKWDLQSVATALA